MFMASKTGYLDRAQVDTASLFTILRFLRGIHSAWSSARPKKTNRILQFHGNNNLPLQKKILNGFLSLYLEVHFQLQVDILINYIYITIVLEVLEVPYPNLWALLHHGSVAI
jgi:hypothetical protein